MVGEDRKFKRPFFLAHDRPGTTPDFAVGFPITLGVGVVGMFLTLPLMQAPFMMALERVLTQMR